MLTKSQRAREQARNWFDEKDVSISVYPTTDLGELKKDVITELAQDAL